MEALSVSFTFAVPIAPSSRVVEVVSRRSRAQSGMPVACLVVVLGGVAVWARAVDSEAFSGAGAALICLVFVSGFCFASADSARAFEELEDGPACLLAVADFVAVVVAVLSTAVVVFVTVVAAVLFFTCVIVDGAAASLVAATDFIAAVVVVGFLV